MDDFIRVPRYVDGEISEDRPQLRQGQEVALKGNPGKVRKVLHAEWHYEKGAWAYVVEVSGQHYAGFEPKFLLEELEVP